MLLGVEEGHGGSGYVACFHTPLGREPCDLFFSWGRLACSGGCRRGMEVVDMSEGKEEEEEEAYVVCGQGVGSRLSSLRVFLSLPL